MRPEFPGMPVSNDPDTQTASAPIMLHEASQSVADVIPDKYLKKLWLRR